MTNISERIGIGRKESKKHIEELQDRKRTILKELKAMNFNPFGSAGIPPKYLELTTELQTIEGNITNTRDWYSVNVLESLETETKTLKWLTVVLIALTVVLAVFTGLLVSGVKLP